MGKQKKGKRYERPRYSRRDSQYGLSYEEDIALLSKPFESSIKGVLDLMKAYGNGTKEVQYLLQYECGLLFECRLCKSIFRSIVNFITHKRVYCQGKVPSDASQSGQSFSEFMNDVQSLVIIKESQIPEQAATPIPVPQSCSTEEDKEKKPSPARLSKRKPFPRKNLVEVLDQLCQKRGVELENSALPTASKRVCTSVTGDSKPPVPVLCLENILGTDVAMHQTVTLGPDGKILDERQSNKSSINEVIQENKSAEPECESNQTEESTVERLCKQCNITFSTRKTFRQHLKSKHNSNRSWYLCPDCNSVFSQIYSVHRHLRKFHRKSESQMQKLHGKIKHLPENQLPSSYAESVFNKKAMAKIVSQENRVNAQRGIGIDNEVAENITGDKTICNGCNRKFDRVAAFNTHMQTCPKRPAFLNNPKVHLEPPSSMFRSVIKNAVESGVMRSNTTETLDVQYASAHSELSEKVLSYDSATSDVINLSDVQSQSAVLNHRPWHENEIRSEPPVKRIEIQLRMDYNKATSSAQAAPNIDLPDVTTMANTRKSPEYSILNDNLISEESQLPSTSATNGMILLAKPVYCLENLMEDTRINNSNFFMATEKDVNIREMNFLENSTANLSTAGSSKGNSQDHIHSAVLLESIIKSEDSSSQSASGSMQKDTLDDECDSRDSLRQEFLENHMDTSETLMLVDDSNVENSNDIQVAPSTFNKPQEYDQLASNSKIAQKKFLRYRCGECLRDFSSIRGCQTHIDKCHVTAKILRHWTQSNVLSSSWTCVSYNVELEPTSSQMNGDLLEIPSPVTVDYEKDDLLSVCDTLESTRSISNQNPSKPVKCPTNVHCNTSKLQRTSSKEHNYKVTSSFHFQERKRTRSQSSNKFGLRPKRHRVFNQSSSAAASTRKPVCVPSIYKLANVKPIKRTQKEVKRNYGSNEKKTDLTCDDTNYKQAKEELSCSTSENNSLESDIVNIDIQQLSHENENDITTSSSISSQSPDPVATAFDDDGEESIKFQVQDNANIYKNVSKSVIEVIFGSDLSNSIFSSNCETEEVNIIEDQVSGTFSLDISSTSEKDKHSSASAAVEDSSDPQERISFTIDSDNISSHDLGVVSPDVFEVTQSVEDSCNSRDSVCSSPKVIEESVRTNKTRLELEGMEEQEKCPSVLSDELEVEDMEEQEKCPSVLSDGFEVEDMEEQDKCPSVLSDGLELEGMEEQDKCPSVLSDGLEVEDMEEEDKCPSVLSDGLEVEGMEEQDKCPSLLSDAVSDSNSGEGVDTKLVGMDTTCLVNKTSLKQDVESSVNTFSSAIESKSEGKQITTGYNISTRNSMRVFDTKPLRRTPVIDTDTCNKR